MAKNPQVSHALMRQTHSTSSDILLLDYVMLQSLSERIANFLGPFGD